MKKSRLLISIPVVILKTRNGYNAFSPAVTGCVATAKSIDTILKQFREALEFHFEGLKLVKRPPIKTNKILNRVFKDYGTEAVYASIDVAA